jgi:hypothetical protein
MQVTKQFKYYGTFEVPQKPIDFASGNWCICSLIQEILGYTTTTTTTTTRLGRMDRQSCLFVGLSPKCQAQLKIVFFISANIRSHFQTLLSGLRVSSETIFNYSLLTNKMEESVVHSYSSILLDALCIKICK